MNVDRFIDACKLDQTRLKLDNALHVIDVNIDLALDLFNCCIREVAECMKKRVPKNGMKKRHEWFDVECGCGRRNVRRLLRVFRRTLSDTDRQAY